MTRNLDRYDASVGCGVRLALHVELQDDHHAAQRQDLLSRARTALEAAQTIVLGVHGTDGINLVDAVQAMETAIADVDFEMERGS